MPWKRCLNKRDSVYLYIINLCTELDRFCLLAPYDRAYVITVNTDNTVTDFPTFKEFLFLYKNLSDYGKPFLIILCICEWRAVFSVNVIPLYDEFSRSPIMRRFSILVLESFFSCNRTDRIPQYPYICYGDVLYQDLYNAGRYADRAIRSFPKGASCP